MDHELRWIQEELAGFGERSSQFRYPDRFRRRVAQYAGRREAQVTCGQIAREVGVPWVTIRRWQQIFKKTEELPAVTRPQAMVPVHVTAVQQTTTSRRSSSVTSPCGWRIEGLDVDEICTVLERLL